MNCAKMKSGSRFLYVTRSAGPQWESKEIIALKMLIDSTLYITLEKNEGNLTL